MAPGSIGNMTNTLIETGARHMQQCRTNYDVLVALAEGEDNLLQNDDKWCMAKDELVVSCGRNIIPGCTILSQKNAYPSVVTTLGDMTESQQNILAAYYHFVGTDGFHDLSHKIAKNTDASKKNSKEFAYRNFVPVGYSVGRACAHAYKGDTIASVQIGGLRTVLNGAFEVQTGDLMQMYIPSAESKMFLSNGGRRKATSVDDIIRFSTESSKTQLDCTGKQRRDFYSRGLGTTSDGNTRVKTGMFSVKPYVESQNEEGYQYQGDKLRVFARALSCARPYEPLDIMIARQSL
jgi:hypothetical protein